MENTVKNLPGRTSFDIYKKTSLTSFFFQPNKIVFQCHRAMEILKNLNFTY